MLHWMLPTTGPSAPVPLFSVTCSPRDAVCAVPYSQLSPEPPTASSLHCWRIGAVESIAQKDVTVLLLMSFRPTSSLAGAACSCWIVQACEHRKLVLHAALAPGSPSCALKLKRPTVGGSAPWTVVVAVGHVVLVVVELVVVVVVVLAGLGQASAVGATILKSLFGVPLAGALITFPPAAPPKPTQ